MSDPAPEDLDTFIELSEVLLDTRPLDRHTARSVFGIIERAAPAHYGQDGSVTPLQALLATFRQLCRQSSDDLESRVVSTLYADGTLGPLAKNLLITWYNGALGSDVLPSRDYAAALVWSAISAQPPGLPGPYFGSWAYPPPRPVPAPEPERQPAGAAYGHNRLPAGST